MTPSAAWRELLSGNERFVRNQPAWPNQDAARRAEVVSGQRPFALVFGCSDSRVPAEIIFDQGLGDLFVVRTAGHVVDTAVLGSVEYGVDVLGVPLVVVLGHDRCGAVGATLAAHTSGELPTGYVRDLVERVTPSVLAARQAGLTGLAEVIDEHARRTARLLVERSPAIRHRLTNGTCAVASARYHLETGTVRLVDLLGEADVLGELADQLPGGSSASTN